MAVVALLLVIPAFAAEEPFLVADSTPGPSSTAMQNPIASGGALFVRGWDPVHGAELWRSDGTAAGTGLIKDINPGIGAGYLGGALFASADVDGTLFFKGYEPTTGGELWKSDGTSAGTVLVKDINPGVGSSNIWYFVASGGTLFFRGYDATHGGELWKSDGTAAGTVLVKDIYPGVSGGYAPGSSFLPTDVNGTLFFRGRDTAHGFELWKSDGTAAGTVLVKDIYPGSASSSPQRFARVGSTLFFTANDGVHGLELWKSDGTAAGTVLVKDISPGASSAGITDLTASNGRLFFRGYETTHGGELWTSDGTAAGTVLVEDIVPGTGSSVPQRLIDVAGTLFFNANTTTYTYELWKSDGSAGGTSLVKTITPGTPSSVAPRSVASNGTLFLLGSDPSHGRELWRSDGTTAGTLLVKDINPGPTGSYPRWFHDVDGTLFFHAYEGTHGLELWACAANQAPVAQCTSVTVSANGNCEGVVTAQDVDDGSWDPDGDSLTLSLAPAGPYELGITSVTLTVDDGNGETDSCVATITVVDTTAPVPSCSVATTSLPAPNKKMVDVGVEADAIDACGGSPGLTVSVYSDEGNGTGRHSPDASIDGNGDLELRRERDGGGDGRVYLIVVSATDAAGNTASCCCTVVVPHDQSAAASAAVAAEAASAKAYCESNGGAAPAGFVALLSDAPLP